MKMDKSIVVVVGVGDVVQQVPHGHWPPEAGVADGAVVLPQQRRRRCA